MIVMAIAQKNTTRIGWSNTIDKKTHRHNIWHIPIYHDINSYHHNKKHKRQMIYSYQHDYCTYCYQPFFSAMIYYDYYCDHYYYGYYELL